MVLSKLTQRFKALVSLQKRSENSQGKGHEDKGLNIPSTSQVVPKRIILSLRANAEEAVIAEHDEVPLKILIVNQALPTKVGSLASENNQKLQGDEKHNIAEVSRPPSIAQSSTMDAQDEKTIVLQPIS